MYFFNLAISAQKKQTPPKPNTSVASKKQNTNIPVKTAVKSNINKEDLNNFYFNYSVLLILNLLKFHKYKVDINFVFKNKKFHNASIERKSNEIVLKGGDFLSKFSIIISKDYITLNTIAKDHKFIITPVWKFILENYESKIIMFNHLKLHSKILKFNYDKERKIGNVDILFLQDNIILNISFLEYKIISLSLFEKQNENKNLILTVDFL